MHAPIDQFEACVETAVECPNCRRQFGLVFYMLQTNRNDVSDDLLWPIATNLEFIGLINFLKDVVSYVAGSLTAGEPMEEQR